MMKIISGILLYGGSALGLAAIVIITIRDARGMGYSQKKVAITCAVALGMLLSGGVLMMAWLTMVP